MLGPLTHDIVDRECSAKSAGVDSNTDSKCHMLCVTSLCTLDHKNLSTGR